MPGSRGIPGKLVRPGGGASAGNGEKSESLGMPGSPIGGFVPGGMIGSIPAIGLRLSGGGSPRFSASSICFSSGG